MDGLRKGFRLGLRPSTGALFGILVGSSLLSTLSVPVVGRFVRPEHVAAPLVFAVFVALRLVRRETPIRLDVVAALAVGWVLVNALSSCLFAPQPMESFVHVVRIGFLVAIFLTVANLPLQRPGEWAAAFRLWLGLGIFELAYGLVSWFLALFWDVWLVGTSLEPDLAGISIRGTQYERNLFGVLAATLLLVVSYTIAAQRSRRWSVLASTGFLWTSACLASVMLVLSLTRSAWLATLVAAPVTFLLVDHRPLRRRDRSLVYVGGGLPVVLAVLIGFVQLLPPSTTTQAEQVAPGTRDAWVSEVGTINDPVSEITPGSDVADRLSSFGRLETDVTLSTRAEDALWALADWRERPLLGHGTGSFGQIHGVRAGTQAWISNLVLHTLVDTGVVGLIVQMALFGFVAFGAWRAANVTSDPQLEIGLRALTVGFVVMVTAYQLTDGTWLATFWIHLGLMANAVASVGDVERDSQPSPMSVAAAERRR